MRARTIMTSMPFGALFAPIIAQDTQTTWGAVVFTMNGETEPNLSNSLYPSLTSIGANQAFNAGSVIRARYIENSTTGSFPGNVTEFAYIKGIRSDVVDNSQLAVLSTDEEGVMNSATAFNQGLYPSLSYFERDTGTQTADGYVQYPLGGYQYVNTESVSSLDWNQIWVDGTANCINWDLTANNYVLSSTVSELKTGTSGFYQSLNSIVFSPLQLPSSQLTFSNAYNLYQYAAYQYAHNATVQANLPASSLSLLRILASQQQFSLYGNLSATSPDATTSDEILAIGGKTLAYKVIGYLGSTIGSNGLSNKLNLMFGGYAPFLSFFSLAGLSTHSSGMNPEFQSLPEPGSVLVFELFSVNDANTNTTTQTMPDENSLWVRFLFRNGTAESALLQSYPLFGRGNSMTDMTWQEFKADMLGLAGGDVASWCNTCGASAIWCPLFVGDNNSQDGSSSNGLISGGTTSTSRMSASVAGVIGAVVTLSVVILALLAAMFIGGLRFSKRETRRNSGLGGFKGAEKMKSDIDVNVVKTANMGAGAGATVRHERVGSWELGEGMVRKAQDEEGGVERVVSTKDYSKDDDAHSVIDPFGDPVKIDDRI